MSAIELLAEVCNVCTEVSKDEVVLLRLVE